MFVPPLTTFTGLWKNSKRTLYPPTLRSDACRMVLPRPARPVLRWGSVMFLPPRHDIDRPVEEFRTELCIRRPCVLMHAGWSYATVRRCMRWGSVMFITPRHDINDLWKNSEQTLYPPTCSEMRWSYATRPPVYAGVA
ncbi:hypothetical protein TNCT_571641 [Trichonephila clavata]|uniref:Uncharacterized protein n=1 Tax=Trichonephila clavata TaxID=2740835 RepID=A0A8X6FG13_TRICU|nr:hypothetical protein TNCT_571641 [Trichonephila clavata]